MTTVVTMGLDGNVHLRFSPANRQSSWQGVYPSHTRERSAFFKYVRRGYLF